MPENANNQETELGAFLEAAGSSLTEAQDKLGVGLDLPTGMLLSDADLEVKAAVRSDEEGRLTVQTFTAQEIRQGGIDPGVLSSFRVRFLAAAAEPGAVPSQVGPRKLDRDQVIDAVRKRTDLASLAKILGGLKYDTTFVPESRRWLVTVRDPQGRIVREAVLPDELEEGGRP